MHTRRNHLILVGIILATLVGVALIGVPSSPLHKKTRLGLDLQGGLEVVLQAVPPKGQKVTQQGLDNAVSIMRSRVDKLGVAEPEIRKQGGNQIVVQLPGVKDAAQAAQLIGKTAQLEFYDLQGDLTGPSVTTSGFARYPGGDPEPLQPPRRTTVQGEAGDPDRVLPLRQEQAAPGRPVRHRVPGCSARATARCRRAAGCSRSRPARS